MVDRPRIGSQHIKIRESMLNPTSAASHAGGSIPAGITIVRPVQGQRQEEASPTNENEVDLLEDAEEEDRVNDFGCEDDESELA